MAVQAAAEAAAVTNSNATATRARRHTREGKRELRQGREDSTRAGELLFLPKKKCPLRFTLLLFLFTPPLATLFYTVCSYSKAYPNLA